MHAPAANPATKYRRYRQRRARGRRMIAVECDEIALVERLIEHGLLAAADADDAARISAALSKVIAHWVESA